MRTLIAVLVISPLLWLATQSSADACQGSSIPLADAVRQSDRLVSATVVSSKLIAPPRRGSSATIAVRLKVKRVTAGVAQPGALIELRYSEPMPVFRPGMPTPCPLVPGSGIEFNLKVGTTYELLTQLSSLTRAVPMSQAGKLRTAWIKQHWSTVLPAPATRARVVLRAKVLGSKLGRKLRWTRVRPLQVFKNVSGTRIKAPLTVAYDGRAAALRPGAYTLYLESYAAGSKRWRLLDAKTSVGASHHRPAAKR